MPENSWSVPESTVLSHIRSVLESNRDGVLVTIVDVDGRAYKRPGAKMVIPEDGTGVGSVTAGCLEDEVLRLAESVLADQTPRLETFDLMSDDEVWGLGVGCNGVIKLLIEPLTDAYEPLLDAYESGNAITSLTVLPTESTTVNDFQRMYYRPDDGFSTGSGPVPATVTDNLSQPASQFAASGATETVEVDHNGETVPVFLDGITSPPTLVVVGTGHDVKPVIKIASKADFRTVVIGYRGAKATADRFTQADTVVSTSPTDIREAVAIDEATYFVVMTHNFIDDRLTINELLATPTPYIGLMGPRERFEEMLEAKDGCVSTAELDAVYTPIGLDLGGGSPYQIALSIVSEVLAVHNDRTPRHLRDREGPIHDRIDTDPLV